MEIDLSKLKIFLIEAKKSTYASGNKSQKRYDGADFFKFSKENFNYELIIFKNKILN